MIKKVLFTILLILLWKPSSGQLDKQYSVLVSDALNLYEKKDYLNSALKYSEAFKKYGNHSIITDRYLAACAWALANNRDSAFNQLFKVIDKSNFIFEDYVVSNSDLSSLHTDSRWDVIMDVIDSKENDDQMLDKPLGNSLKEIYFKDVSLRKQAKEIERKFGFQSDTVKTLWKKITENDSTTLIKVKLILDSRGWLGSDVIGVLSNRTLFLSIQHSNLKTQEKYLPMLRYAVQIGDANPANYAYLIDRIAIEQGKKQIYGTQLSRDKKSGEVYILPLEDPDKVNLRRKEIGLGSIEDYISPLGITWNLNKYK
jgi:hypothetical protein